MLELKDVNHNYGNFKIKNIFLKINTGELIGIIGKNGSGKTTLLKIIAGIIKSNNVYMNGTEVNIENLSDISYMDSNPFFYELLTVNEMIDFVKYIYNNYIDNRIYSWIKEIGLSRYQDELIKNLSLGNRQKLSFILTLINNPKVILLDEPFNGVDEYSVNIIISILKKLISEKKIVLITTHLGSILNDMCTRIIKLDEGAIIEDNRII